jgi:precorrin-2/cobalt-factor-2 C20-methyltransferase
MNGGSGPRGRLFGIGVGPGDPDLMSVKAVRLISQTSTVAYFAARNRPSIARGVAEHLLTDRHREIRIDYPLTVERAAPDDPVYEQLLAGCYDAAARRIEIELEQGYDVALLCEGDPFFYGSYMYVHNRLADRFETTVVPGIPSLVAGAAAISTPLACGNEVLSVLSGVLSVPQLTNALAACDAAVIIKLGRNLASVQQAVAAAHLLDRAFYNERASSERQVCCPLAQADSSRAPYFSMVVIPSLAASRR